MNKNRRIGSFVYNQMSFVKGKENLANIYFGKWLAGGSLRTNDWFQESNKVEILNRNTLESPQLNGINFYPIFMQLYPKSQ